MHARTLVTPPVVEPVTLAEARAQCNVDLDDTDPDSQLVAHLLAARELVELETGRSLLAQTWDLILDSWPGCIVLPGPPVGSVTSVKYIDTAGTEQTLDPLKYQLLKLNTDEFELLPAYGQSWPSVRTQRSAIVIRYVAGYDTLPGNTLGIGAVPETLRQAIKLCVGHWYKNREAVDSGQEMREIPLGFERLVGKLRIRP